MDTIQLSRTLCISMAKRITNFNTRGGGILAPGEAKDKHLRTLLQKGYTVHIRPIFLIGHDGASAARVVSAEAQIADVFNTFDIDGRIGGAYRSQKIFDEYEEGVPGDMKDVEYGKLNLAHQLTQGRKKGSSPPCAMIGKGCQQKDSSKSKATATSLVYTLEGNQVYMCTLCKCSWKHAYHDHPHEDLQDAVDFFNTRMEDRHWTERNLSLDGKGPCESCGEEEVLSRAFLNTGSHVLCSRCSQRWRGWSGDCDWAGSISKDMSNEECEEVWDEFVCQTVEWVSKVESSKANRAKGSCVACSATAETTPMRSLPEDFCPNEGDDKDVICPQCLTQFSTNRTRKIYDWKDLQSFIDTRMAIYEDSKKDAATRSARNLCVCSTLENEVTGTALVGLFKWKEEYPMLCSDCAEIWRRHSYKKTKKDAAYDFSTIENFISHCRKLRMDKKAAAARSKLCVCSTPEHEVVGTGAVSHFRWFEEYPLLCKDCAEVWRRHYYMKTVSDAADDSSTLEKLVIYVHNTRQQMEQ